MNDRGVYHYFLTGKDMSILHCYRVYKKGEARNDHKVKTGCFWSKRLYNSFTQNIGLVMKFEVRDDESDTKYDRTTNTNIEECGDVGNCKLADPDV